MQSLTQKQIDRFWGKVDKEKSTTFYSGERCWEWIAACNKDGYGVLGLFSFHGIQHFLAHRVSWELNFGSIPDSLFVLHHCDNPPCVNPDHLFLGTKKDNSDDMIAKGRSNRSRGDEHWTHFHPDKIAHQNGENNGSAKLTQPQIEEIRYCYKRGNSQYILAKKYGVSQALISLIVNNKIWK